MNKLKQDHAQEIKKIHYKNQVKYSQLSKADQDKLKALEKQQAETYLLIEKQALAEQESKKPPSKTFEEVQQAKTKKMEATGKILNEKDETAIDMEFHKMIEDGHFETLTRLREDNKLYKDVIIQMQDEMRSTVQESLDAIEKLMSTQKINAMRKQLSKVMKRCTLDEKAKAEVKMVNLGNVSEANLHEMMQENVKRFKKFLRITVNPVSVSELVDRTESVNIKHIKYDNLIEKRADRVEVEKTDQSTQTLPDSKPLELKTGPIKLHGDAITQRKIVDPNNPLRTVQPTSAGSGYPKIVQVLGQQKLDSEQSEEEVEDQETPGNDMEDFIMQTQGIAKKRAIVQPAPVRFRIEEEGSDQEEQGYPQPDPEEDGVEEARQQHQNDNEYDDEAYQSEP